MLPQKLGNIFVLSQDQTKQVNPTNQPTKKQNDQQEKAAKTAGTTAMYMYVRIARAVTIIILLKYYKLSLVLNKSYVYLVNDQQQLVQVYQV